MPKPIALERPSGRLVEILCWAAWLLIACAPIAYLIAGAEDRGVVAVIGVVAGLAVMFVVIAPVSYAIKRGAYHEGPYLRASPLVDLSPIESARPGETLAVTFDGVSFGTPSRVAVAAAPIVMAQSYGVDVRSYFHVALVFADRVVRVRSFRELDAAELYAQLLAQTVGLPDDAVARVIEHALENATMGATALACLVDLAMLGMAVALLASLGAIALLVAVPLCFAADRAIQAWHLRWLRTITARTARELYGIAG